MGEWIQEGERTYRCSLCGGLIQTGTPIEWWTRCPFCHAPMKPQEEEPDGSLHSAENS